MMNPFQRRDYKNRYSDRPKPHVPNCQKAPEITGKLTQTLQYLRDTAGQSDDLVVRKTKVSGSDAAVIYYTTITDPQVIDTILGAVQDHDFPRSLSHKEMPDYLSNHVIPSGNVIFIQNLWEVREALSRGEIVLLVDRLSVAITTGAMKVTHRAVSPPLVEASSRGPQIALVEDIMTNVGLMRKMLAVDTLTVTSFYVGYRSRTQVVMMYQHDVANPNLVETAKKRIEAVHIDKLTGSATLEQRIVDNHWTFFPLTRATSRVDNCVKEVGQGKVLILVDGDPTALLIPGSIIDFFQTMEDDQHSYVDATFIRWLRMIAFVLSFYLPALYIAFTDYNPELMPQVLALQIARSREGVPFNATMEVILMQLVVEILREATLRMPKVMGQTIGIVGGLVLGQAAVEAGLVSNIVIVGISLTAVAVFVLPSYEFAVVLRLLLWINILGASLFGFYGIMIVVLAIIFHVASLKSFGIAYLTPLSGEHTRDLFLDGVVRVPIPILDRRAAHLHDQESTRAADFTDPARHPMLEVPRGPKQQAAQRRRQKNRTRPQS